MNIQYFVRTTEDREFDYDLDYEILVDTEHKAVDSFIEALYYISDFDAVLLEDDLVLCKNFKEEIEKVIMQYPDKIINFFSGPRKYYSTHFSDFFDYNQCTYYPKAITKKLADEMTILHSKYPKARSYNFLETKALVNLGISHLVYRPTLVQHKDVKSILNDGAELKRITPYFKDYIDELGIAYEDAFKLENKKRLDEMVEKDTIKFEKEMRGDIKDEFI